MQYEPGHIYLISPFHFKNGTEGKAKFFIPLHVASDGSVTGTLVSSRERDRVPTGSLPGKAMVYDNGHILGFFLPFGTPVTDSGFAFRCPTFSYFNEALRYTPRQINNITAAATNIRDFGALDEKLFADITASFIASEGVSPELRAEMRRSMEKEAGEKPKSALRLLGRIDRDRLSELGVTARRMTELQRDGVLVYENRNLEGGRAIIVLSEGGLCIAVAADGTVIGPLRNLVDLIKPRLMKDTTQTPAPKARSQDKFPPGTLRPYLEKESAIKWLAVHLGGGMEIDRKTMYHLNIANSITQHEKEIYKRIPSSRFGGLPEGGRRNVAASLLLRAGKEANGRKQEDILPSGYTREQQLVGSWAERDGCWEDYAEQALRDKGMKDLDFGSEARVLKGDGGYVYKTIDMSHYGSLEKVLDRISLHNAIFPETAMTVEGFGTRDDAETREDYVVTVRQPFVQGRAHTGPGALDEVRAQMKKRDFDLVKPVATPDEIEDARRLGKPVPEYASSFWCLTPEDKSVLLYDLHDQNMVFDDKGNMLVFDCEIRLNDSPRLGGPYEIPSVEWDEDAVRRIDAFMEELVPAVKNRREFEAMYATDDNLLREQLEYTGRYEGLVCGPFDGDRWLVAVNPENNDEVLVLPKRNAGLMISILPDGQFTPEERSRLVNGLSITGKDGRNIAFSLDKGRVAGVKSWLKIRQAIADREEVGKTKERPRKTPEPDGRTPHRSR